MWLRTLTTVKDVLSKWRAAQQQWLPLRPLFLSMIASVAAQAGLMDTLLLWAVVEDEFECIVPASTVTDTAVVAAVRLPAVDLRRRRRRRRRRRCCRRRC